MMKKLKVLLVAMVLVMGVAFYVPTVSAETTTEPTTEEVTTEDSLLDLGDVDVVIEKVKVWIIGISLGLVSTLLSSGVASYFLNKSKNKIFGFVTQAKNENKISQTTANNLIQQSNELHNMVGNSINNLETTFNDKMETMGTEIQESVNGFAGLTGAFTQALLEYVESDDDE